jgi:hypothetical protein
MELAKSWLISQTDSAPLGFAAIHSFASRLVRPGEIKPSDQRDQRSRNAEGVPILHRSDVCENTISVTSP